MWQQKVFWVPILHKYPCWANNNISANNNNVTIAESTSTDARTGEQEYSPNRNSSSWLNIAYGKKWKPAVFLGYMKNLGTSDEISKMYGTGTNVDQLVSTSAELTYNVPHWKLGVEYNLTSAWYGSMKSSNGKIIDTHSVSNNRLVATVLFMF